MCILYPLHVILFFIQDGVIDEARQHQMTLTRQLCIPTICMLLLTVLHSTGKYKECFTLINIIASEDHQLYRVSFFVY